MSEKCKCCHLELDAHAENCPRCGLTVFKLVGSNPDQEKALEPFIHTHRQSFLKKFKLGVTCYYWKDQNGTIVQDTTRTLSFGTAAELLDGTVWLDQEFARLPDEKEIAIDLTISETGAADRTVQVRVTPPTEPQLQRLGAQLGKDLQLRLLVKNEKTTCTSSAAAFF